MFGVRQSQGAGEGAQDLTSGVPDEEQGLAAGMLNSSLQVGGAVGLAVVTAAIMPGTELSTLRPGLVVILAFGVLTLLAQRREPESGTDLGEGTREAGTAVRRRTGSAPVDSALSQLRE